VQDFLHVLKRDPRKYARAQELLLQQEQISAIMKSYKLDDIPESDKVKSGQK
jgi:hypothetical protein